MSNTNKGVASTPSNASQRYLALLGTDVRPFVEVIEGMSYIPAGRAVALAGRPAHTPVDFTDDRGCTTAVRRLFGGTAVAVDMPVGNRQQRTYLPLLDLRGNPIPAGRETARDVGDTRQRCLARAIAIVHGLGLSLYSLTEGDGKAYAQALAVSPQTADIAKVEPLRDIKEFKDKRTGKVIRTQEYLGWHAGIAACRITDAEFHWEIVEFTTVNPDTGEICQLPAMKLEGKGWLVAVKIVYQGIVHTQYLPIMGVETVQTKTGPKPMEHQPIDQPTVFQWHSAVMRCLIKGIALATGYGIALYAKGDYDALEFDDAEQAATPESKPAEAADEKPAEAAKSETQVATGSTDAGVRPRLVGDIRRQLTETGSEESVFVGWLTSGKAKALTELDASPVEVLIRGQAALVQKRDRMTEVTDPNA